MPLVANTAYLRYTVEPWVRARLEERYGRPFSSRVLGLTTGGKREFDAVSDDLSIVASIKAHSGLTSGGRNPSAKISSALLEVYFLTLVPAEVKLLILTDPEFFDIFAKNTAGRVAPGIAVERMALPAKMQAAVREVTRSASIEMGTGRDR
jgi:hypothetical protein